MLPSLPILLEDEQFPVNTAKPKPAVPSTRTIWTTRAPLNQPQLPEKPSPTSVISSTSDISTPRAPLNPEQRINLEHNYLLEDKDVLWEQLCRRKFRTQKKECESWREMFMRCTEEREAKLRSVTQKIKLSQAEKAASVRKTHLAYVDSAVKTPRSVISKQARYGTDRKPVVSAAALVLALKSASFNVANAGDTRLKVASGAKDPAQAVSQPNKPKKAPMMIKLLKSIKKLGFRR